MRFVKLTHRYGGEYVLYVDGLRSIQRLEAHKGIPGWVEPREAFTRIGFNDGSKHEVTETPEQILEMVEDSYPTREEVLAAAQQAGASRPL
jgi:hypothetical protein